MKIQQLFLIFIVPLWFTVVYGQQKGQHLDSKQQDMTSQQQELAAKKQQVDFKKLECLLGKWKRTNGKPGQITTEEWVKKSAFKLKGTGVKITGADTAFVEKMTLLIKDNAIFFVADVKENKGLVYFKLTAIDANGFTCENASHDFPKKIVYKQSGKELQATISGNGKSIGYTFLKL